MGYFFGGKEESVSDPADSFVAVTPHATNPIEPLPKGLHIGVGGDIVIRGASDGADVTMTVAAGYHPLRPRFIRATGTTATQIVALY